MGIRMETDGSEWTYLPRDWPKDEQAQACAFCATLSQADASEFMPGEWCEGSPWDDDYEVRKAARIAATTEVAGDLLTNLLEKNG